MITATIIGKYFQSKNNELSEIQIQKLTYYAYVWYMVINNGKKLFEERPQAWVHGPVFRTLFNDMKYNRNKFLNMDAELEVLGQDVRNFLDTIYRLYGKYSGNELESLTHSEMPWRSARQGKKDYEYSEELIRDEDIMQYYGQA